MASIGIFPMYQAARGNASYQAIGTGDDVPKPDVD